MSNPLEIPEQQLPGYRPIDRLGAGGYGEVWRAEAPGGLFKAVKYVYGRQDGSRAASELKALERVRGVRHPFLLSLERIEVVDGRLIVVTELADASLRERYFACVDEGLPGIPRDELLGYLRDAADALDYLSRDHHLQHLDIKPENLLLLAGHVKVADYGLVKCISDQTQSLVGGMTPTYAGPEVFQGKPSTHSDQYSLAILYQELLTGTLPFPGATAAELTMQHLNEDPALEPLGEHDRFAVSRALSKNPDNRFGSCTEFVQALFSGFETGEAVTANFASTPQRHKVTTRRAESTTSTEVFDEDDDAAWGKSQAPMLIDLPPLPEPPARIREMPRLEPEEFNPSPAIFIGVGGSGGRILRRLRQRITDRFDCQEAIPTLSMLLLDTDSKSLLAVARGAEQGHGLSSDETITLSLRRPQEYRAKSPQLLKWIGRRWMYNIPRSQQTEGIRPLGRLALVDHARQAFQRIRRAMTLAISDESLAQAKQLTGVDFQPQKLRVYLCGSISGGAGSGMTLDVAYAIRSILNRLPVTNAQLLGVLTHSSSRDSSRGELARLNAFSWLSEFQHFANPANAYPGDESCGLPAHDSHVCPFDSTYLVHLGANLDTIALQNATEEVADYLYLDATTAAQSVLDACRAESKAEGSPTLRSFSLNRIEAAAPEACQAAQQLVLRRLVDCWTGEEATSDKESVEDSTSRSTTYHLVNGVTQVVTRLKLEPSELASLSRTLIETHLGTSLENIVQGWGQTDPVVGKVSARQALLPIAKLFACRGDAADASPAIPIALGIPHKVATQPLSEIVRPLANKLGGDLRSWIVSRFDQPRERGDGARRAAQWFEQHLQGVCADLDRLSKAAAHELTSWRESLEKQASASGEMSLAALRIRGLKQMVDFASIEAARSLAGEVGDAIPAALQEIEETCQKLGQLIGATDNETAVQYGEDPLAASVARASFPQLEKRVQEELLVVLGGATRVASDASLREQFRDGLRRIIEKEVMRGYGEGHGGKGGGGSHVFDCDEPRLATCGGVLRRLAVRPSDKSQVADRDQTPWLEISSPQGESLRLIEAEGLSLPHVAAELVDHRRDYADLAERVHTRKDIAWSAPIDNPRVTTDANPFTGVIQEGNLSSPFDGDSTPCTQVLTTSTDS